MHMNRFILYGGGMILLWAFTRRYNRSRREENRVAVNPEPDPVDPIDIDIPVPDPVHIPDDLLVHIFKRLSIKSILQLRCVSQHLGRIINGPVMIREHLRFSGLNPLLLFQRANARYDELDLSRFNGTRFYPLNSQAINPLQWQVCVIGCANGLICMSFELGSSPYFVVWNPEIKRYRLVFIETWAVQYVLGFGFNKRDIDYKLVMLITRSEGFVYKVEVFSLYFSQVWRSLDFGNSLDNVVFESDGETITGAGVVVWLAHSSSSSKNIMVLFDTAVESFRLIDLPLSRPSAFDFKFTEYQERVAFLCTPVRFITTVLELWVMDEDMGGWNRRIRTPPIDGAWGPAAVFLDEVICGKQRHEEVVHDIELVGDDEEHALAEMILHCHHVNTDAVRRIGTRRFQSPRFIFNYVKSLVPVFQPPEEA